MPITVTLCVLQDSLERIFAIKSLQDDNSFIMPPADKGNATVETDKVEY